MPDPVAENFLSIKRLAPQDRSGRGRTPTSKGIQVYGVIRGRPTETKVAKPSGDQPHYHILVESTDNHEFDVAVDIHSLDNTEVLYLVNTQFQPPHPEEFLALEAGATSIGSAGASGIGLDYIQQDLVTRNQMSLLPIDANVVTDFSNDITALVQRAIADPSAQLFAFGKLYAAASNGMPNPVFGFSPDAGIHDIHLNQGNPTGNNPTFEDGALLLYYPSDQHWEAAFFAFQDQTF